MHPIGHHGGEAREKRGIKKGQIIFREGDRGDAAYFIEVGSVAIRKAIDGAEMELAQLRSGAIFGEMAVIDDGRRMASAHALEDCLLVRIPKQMFEHKMASCDPFVRGLISIFLNNIRNAHKTYMKRPRSFGDFVLGLSGFATRMRAYANTIEKSEFSEEVAAKLTELESVVNDLDALRAKCPRA